MPFCLAKSGAGTEWGLELSARLGFELTGLRLHRLGRSKDMLGFARHDASVEDASKTLIANPPQKFWNE
jgi:hypothetical protein